MNTIGSVDVVYKTLFDCGLSVESGAKFNFDRQVTEDFTTVREDAMGDLIVVGYRVVFNTLNGVYEVDIERDGKVTQWIEEHILRKIKRETDEYWKEMIME